MLTGRKRAVIRNLKAKSFTKGQSLTASQSLWNLLVEIWANEIEENTYKMSSIREIVRFLGYEIRDSLYLELYPPVNCLNCGITYSENSKEMFEHKCQDLGANELIKSDPVREGVEVYLYYVCCKLSSVAMEKNGCYEVSVSGGFYNRTRELHNDLQEAKTAYDKLLSLVKNEPIIPQTEVGNYNYYSEDLAL